MRFGQTRDFILAKSEDFDRVVVNLARLSRLPDSFERFRKTFAMETFQSGVQTFRRFRPVQPFAQQPGVFDGGVRALAFKRRHRVRRVADDGYDAVVDDFCWLFAIVQRSSPRVAEIGLLEHLRDWHASPMVRFFHAKLFNNLIETCRLSLAV